MSKVVYHSGSGRGRKNDNLQGVQPEVRHGPVAEPQRGGPAVPRQESHAKLKDRYKQKYLNKLRRQLERISPWIEEKDAEIAQLKASQHMSDQAIAQAIQLLQQLQHPPSNVAPAGNINLAATNGVGLASSQNIYNNDLMYPPFGNDMLPYDQLPSNTSFSAGVQPVSQLVDNAPLSDDESASDEDDMVTRFMQNGGRL